MYEKHRERAAFFVVYIREAHPVDGWRVPQNDRQGIEVDEPVTEKEREDVASKCARALKLSIPFLIDDMKNTAQQAYAGWPDRLYVIDTEGKVAYRGDPGPRGFKPAEAEAALKKLLQ
ncbi:MAG: deiodinase [Planctomycetes bacterium]|nr:deiodinase [Planctomycetota bacterium]